MEKIILVPHEKYQRLLENKFRDEGVSRPSAIKKKKKHHTMDTLDISDEFQTDTKEIIRKGNERLGPPGIRMKTKHTKINRIVQPVDDVKPPGWIVYK